MKFKKVWQSKTVWVAVVTGVVGVLTVIGNENPEFKLVGVIAILKAVLDFAMRLRTDKAVKV